MAGAARVSLTRDPGSTAAIRCRAACEDLVAGRPAGSFDGVEAAALRQLLSIHALTGLAVRALDDGTLSITDAVELRIRRDFDEAQRIAAGLERECIRIGIAALASRADSCLRTLPILLKGPSVAIRYRDPPVRTYVDLDLLVPAEDLISWADLLFDLGYRAPRPEVKAAARRYQEGVSFTQAGGDNGLSCDLHACLFIERRAREVRYSRLLPHGEPSRFAGLLQLSIEAQLVVLALHLAHHPASAWRLLWLRDLIELGDAEMVEAGRALAAEWNVGWALERTLLAAEAVLGWPCWDAIDPPSERFGLAQVHQLDVTHYLRHLAFAYELGPIAAGRYLASRLDPRRFTLADRGIDWPAVRAWAVSVGRRMRATPWYALVLPPHRTFSPKPRRHMR